MTASRLPTPLLVVIGAILLMAFAPGPNFVLATYAIAVLLVAVALLWRPGEPPVMLLVFVLQWLQASVKIFSGNLNSVPVNELSQFGGDIALSSALSVTGLILLALGMRWGAGPWNPADGHHSRQMALTYPASVWFKWYLIALAVSFVASGLAGPFAALSQPLLALANLKWAFFFMLTYAAFCGPTFSRQLWAIAAAVEFALGVGGYFSDFKTVILFAALGVAAAGIRLTLGRVVMLSLLVGLTITLVVAWTVVKREYRDFVSDGQEAQVVQVDYVTRLGKLSELVSNIDGQMFAYGFDDLLDRLSYVDFFSSVVEHVPAAEEHTRGAIWADAIIRPFTPRVFFPEKTVIDDSVRTALYTGRVVYGAERGVSISIGYMGESYIDFGRVGMMLPILILGYLMGWVYLWLAITGPMRGLLGFGLASASLMSFAFLESSITKVFGGFVASLLVIWLFGRFIAPRYFRWLMLPPQGH